MRPRPGGGTVPARTLMTRPACAARLRTGKQRSIAEPLLRPAALRWPPVSHRTGWDVTVRGGAQERSRRPGGRAALVVAAVRRATEELLGEVGYEGLVLTEVAARAEVNKTTVYRRWPTKVDLVTDLFLSRTAEQDIGRDTGSLVGDLAVLLEDIVDNVNSPAARAVLSVAIGGMLDDEARTARTAFWAERFHRGATIVDRAVERGELPPGTDARLLLEDACSPVYFRVLLIGEMPTEADIKLFARRAAERAGKASGPGDR
ncbi:TetR/AcrR family transcriptional regulator [Streptomyces sp. NPDC056488]|uniref:TetR/AcrR family transcriptional regulator n=1 Tax=Streptomyces sp. NPDC056488 TaxID=3345836 RepID=UPI0036B91633